MKGIAVDGLMIVDKPTGMTSHDVVLRIRRLLQGRKTGHGGTLDPDASGILLVTIGAATRLFPYLSSHNKVYRGSLHLGFSTDTYDASGKPTSPESFETPSESVLLEAMRRLEGPLSQIPPAYSAKKLNGKPLYKLARANVEVSPKAQNIIVSHFLLNRYDSPLADFEVACSSGTYIRSLVHDLGMAVGCGAHLVSLRRTVSGEFTLSDSRTLEDISRWAEMEAWEKIIHPIEKLLPEFPIITLDVEGEKRACHGNRILPGHISEFPSAGQITKGMDPIFRLFSQDGKFLALARLSSQELELSPFLVLAAE